MSKTHSDRWCYICGQYTSSAGGAWTSHQRKHVREGKTTEKRVSDGGGYAHLEFVPKPGVKLIMPPQRRVVDRDLLEDLGFERVAESVGYDHEVWQDNGAFFQVHFGHANVKSGASHEVHAGVDRYIFFKLYLDAVREEAGSRRSG